MVLKVKVTVSAEKARVDQALADDLHLVVAGTVTGVSAQKCLRQPVMNAANSVRFLSAPTAVSPCTATTALAPNAMTEALPLVAGTTPVLRKKTTSPLARQKPSSLLLETTSNWKA